jgi:aspartate/methionine/tyrosine aminotransferase
MYTRSVYLSWAAQRYGKVRYDLATSGMPAPPPAELGAFTTESMAIGTSWSALRTAIAAYNDVPASETVAALGTTQAVWLACQVLTSPGDDILVEEPGYEPLVRMAESVGAHVLRFERPAAARFALEPDRVLHALTARTRCVIVTNPHNPSGVRVDDETLRVVATELARRGAYLLVDEVYAPFDRFVDSLGVFRGSARKVAPNIVAASSLGKSYGLGAARVGWLLAPGDVIARAEDVMVTVVGALPLAHARVGVQAFARIGALAERARAHLAGKRERVARWAADLDLEWSDPQSGLFGFARMPGRLDLGEVLERAIRDHQVLVAPGEFFGAPDGFRLGWSTNDADLIEGLARLRDALTQEPGR